MAPVCLSMMRSALVCSRDVFYGIKVARVVVIKSRTETPRFAMAKGSISPMTIAL